MENENEIKANAGSESVCADTKRCYNFLPARREVYL